MKSLSERCATAVSAVPLGGQWKFEKPGFSLAAADRLLREVRLAGHIQKPGFWL